MLMTELAQSFAGTPVTIAPHLKGGIPQYDIVDGTRVEVSRIHAMKVDDKLLVSEELYKAMEQKEIIFIQKRWAGRACGTDVKKLVDEIDRLSNIIDIQTDTIEGKILDDLSDYTGG